MGRGQEGDAAKSCKGEDGDERIGRHTVGGRMGSVRKGEREDGDDWGWGKGADDFRCCSNGVGLPLKHPIHAIVIHGILDTF